MFEKEGIKYAIEETVGTECLSMPIEDFHFIDLAESQQEKAQCFKDGAEFGYNKANEWHYVKDGDLPKDKKDMLMSEHLILLTKMKGTAYLNIALGNYNFSTQEFSYQHIVGLTDIIAWKEIELPKEIKENE